ncbi:TetR family transcriptional regulator [Kineococcus sp. SYSU DK006]|uniref:TetR/AcrR family transcriptional regulator n=1 Tax=Kineococcus sp. SYSU DK006 TaxID=3383127 RepID=UPI003D7CAF77
MTSSGTPAGRRERAAATRAAILSAAREAFSERSYDDVGLREVAGRAGVTAAMVNRYFGTKQELFREAVGTEDPTPPQLSSTPREEFGRELAALLVRGGHAPRPGGPDAAPHDPLVLLLRSAGSATARPVLREYVERSVVPPLTACFGADDDAARERAVLVLALLLGTDVLGRMLGVAPLDPASAAGSPALERVLAGVLQAAADS